MKSIHMYLRLIRRHDNVIPILVIISVLLFLLSFLYFSSHKPVWHQPLKTNQQSSFNDMPNISTALRMLQSVDFEVFGIVQGVFFRKYTREKGKELGLKGWCMNTSKGTVTGTMQGKEEKIEEMKEWLRYTGSPMSKIEKCVFSNDRHISKEEFQDFHIKKGDKLY